MQTGIFYAINNVVVLLVNEMRKRSIALLAALMTALFLCACGKEAEEPIQVTDTVSLWCVAGAPGADALAELAEEYSLTAGVAMPVTVKQFPDETVLAESFNLRRPDLLLCSHAREESFAERGLILSIPSLSADALVGVGAGFEGWCDGGFLPLGCELPLLFSAPGAVSGDVTAEELFAAAEENGEGYFAVSSYADLFAALLTGQDAALSFDIPADAGDSRFAALYNRVAELAFSGALCLCSSPAEKVAAGELACAVVSSDELYGIELGDCRISAMPGLAGEKSQFMSTVYGLASTAAEGRDSTAADGFIRWLTEGDRLGTAAMKNGLLPAWSSGGAADALSEAILAVSRDRRLYTCGETEEFFARRDSFDAEMRQALKRLY